MFLGDILIRKECIVISKAFNTLSDPNKRAIHDSGGDREDGRRSVPSYRSTYHRRRREEVSPEDLFNLFFGRNGPRFNQDRYTEHAHFYKHQRYQQYQRQRQHQRQTQQQQQEDGSMKYFPFIFIILALVLSAMMSSQSEPLYTFQTLSPNTYKRVTSLNQVDYFVNPKTFFPRIGNSHYKLREIERQIELDWVNELARTCQREQRQRGYRRSKLPKSCQEYDRLARRL